MLRFVVAGLMLCLTGPALGVHESPAGVRSLDLFDLGAPSFTNFSPSSGVPNTVTVAVQTDRDGFVWIASPSGLARYDGRRWSTRDEAQLAHTATSLFLDRSGTLWASYRDAGLAHYDGAEWHVENRSTGLASEQIRRFAETDAADGSTTLWALTWDRGLLRRHDGKWESDPGNAQLPHGSVLALAQTREFGGRERLWAGTGEEGLWYREGDGEWLRFRSDGFDPAQVEFLLVTQHEGREELWVSVFGSGLWRLRADGLRKWTRESGDLPSNEIYDIAQTPLPNGDRAIWVSSRTGLIRIHGDHAQVFDRRHGLPSDVVRSISAWRSPNGEAVLWLATESGVSRTIIGANQWLTASLLGAQATGVFAVLVEAGSQGNERLWVGGSEGGIGLYEQGRWRYFTQDNGALPGSSVRMIAAADDERGTRTLWVGLRYGHLLRVRDGPVFEPVAVPWPSHSGQAVLDTLSRRVDGRFEHWFATRQSGVYRRNDRGAWEAFRADGIAGQWRVNRLIEQVDRGGRPWLWAIGNQGLARFDGERWTRIAAEAGLVDSDMLGGRLIADAQGRAVIWIGTANAGIVRVDVSDPQHPQRVSEALPRASDPTAYGAVPDSQGRIYVCTNNGVQQLTPMRDGGYASRVFTREDGMVHDECNTNGQFVDAHDRFWTGTLGGLTVYDPRRAMEDQQPKPLKLLDLRVDDRSVHGEHISIEPAVRNVRVEFALLSWQREAESRFRTQLVGYDMNPSPWSSDNSRSFGVLPPGSYRLRIEARDYAGNLSTPLEISIEKAAWWWQTTWANGGLAIALLLVAHALVRWRTRALETQRNALEQRVTARTTELNAANARLRELSYRDALTGLANRRALLEALERHAGDAKDERTTLVFVDVDHFKDYNDHHGHPAGDEALRCVADAMRDCAPADALVARYGGEEFACLLPGCDITMGVALAECIRAEVAARSVPVPGSSQSNRVTISAGVASLVIRGTHDADRLLREADAALYRAKRDGRDRVRTFECAAVPPATA
jgi:diguanylate cyclase (GGDEF)-like protein